MTKTTPFTIVLLPGFDGTGELFYPVIRELHPSIPHADIKVIAYPSDVSYSYAELLSIVESQLPNSAFMVVAESFSGPLGVLLAAKQTALNFKGLVLVATFLQSPSFLLKTLKPLIPTVSKFIYGVLQRPNIKNSFLMKMALSFLIGFRPTAHMCNSVIECSKALKESVIKKRLTELSQVDVRAQASSIKAPVLYLRPGFDILVRTNSLAQITKCIPKCIITKITGGHLVLQANPKDSAAALLWFYHQIKPYDYADN